MLSSSCTRSLFFCCNGNLSFTHTHTRHTFLCVRHVFRFLIMSLRIGSTLMTHGCMSTPNSHCSPSTYSVYISTPCICNTNHTPVALSTMFVMSGDMVCGCWWWGMHDQRAFVCVCVCSCFQEPQPGHVDRIIQLWRFKKLNAGQNMRLRNASLTIET